MEFLKLTNVKTFQASLNTILTLFEFVQTELESFYQVRQKQRFRMPGNADITNDASVGYRKCFFASSSGNPYQATMCRNHYIKCVVTTKCIMQPEEHPAISAVFDQQLSFNAICFFVPEKFFIHINLD